MIARAASAMRAPADGGERALPDEDRQPAPGEAAAAGLTLDFTQVWRVLDLIAKRDRGARIDRRDWQRIYATRPHGLLRQRERQVGSAFADEDFEAFVLGAELAQSHAKLRQAAGAWAVMDMAQAADRALAYLPPGTPLRARICPVIKRGRNSFIHGTAEDAVIFLNLDPDVERDAVANTLSHELHHIGLAAALAARPDPAHGMPSAVAEVLRWLGAFREGFAMLAAAGGLDAHPLAAARPGDRERWDKDMDGFEQHIAMLEAFFLDVLSEGFSAEELERRGLGFYGRRGPWYTVGWQMSALVEYAFGRDALIACMLDPRLLLIHYNAVATHNPSRRRRGWSPAMIAALY